jgi:hypothetical protein
MSEQPQKHVFISYVRENQKQVDRFCSDLEKHGVNVWLDRNSIKPGALWKGSIREAIRQGDFFIACFSKEYLAREKSYMNEELTLAIEELRQYGYNREWFIPVLLSECDVPDRSIGAGETLKDIQQVMLFQDWESGIQRIISVIGNREAPKLRITAPEEIYQSQEYVKVSGNGAIPGNAIILITSLHNKYIAPQEIHVIANSNGVWEYPGCHLFNPGKRYVYALSVKTADEEEVRRLLNEKKGSTTEDAMLKFSEELNVKGISHQLSEPKMLIGKR